MLRHFVKQIKIPITRSVCSYTEPSIEIIEIYEDALNAWKNKDFENAESLIIRAIRMKENRGDKDLDDYEVDLEAIRNIEEYPYLN